MGGGVALLDFNGDGLLDIFFVNGGETPRGKSSKPVRNTLYRNLGNDSFEDVAGRAGVDWIAFYGMGVAVADYDNDGFQDVFLTGYPSSALFHNNGNGTFRHVTDKAGVSNFGKWAASAAWFDYDRDGFLDLFVCNYAKFSFTERKDCEMAGRRAYCEQKAYQGEAPTLYHNNRDGTFTDVTARSGLQKYVGRALGVVSIDINDDSWPDLFVARDASPNLLLINKGDGTFDDIALDAEVAYSIDGVARAGMGVDAADINSDGWPDFVVTNFTDEYHALYASTKSLHYEDRARESGLAALTMPYVGFGTHFIDYDNDGNMDLVIANGHVNELMQIARKDVRYKEPPLLLRNDGRGLFRNMGQTAGSVFRTGYLGRGVAVGDYDNDGGIDIVITCLNSEPVLLRNNVGYKDPWIGFHLIGTTSNRDAIGAKLTIRLGPRKLVRWLTGGSSYLASHDKRVVFGLGRGPLPRAISLEIRWPSGLRQTISGLELGKYHEIREPARGSS
jgi:enediyne biosynthesis protein E4